MIDLERTELPRSIVSSLGEEVRVKTSFRAWLRVARLLREGVFDASIIEGVVVDDRVERRMPDGNVLEGIREFLLSENRTPRKSGSGARTLDYLEDGDYIVGSFQHVYGIDLTVEDMHWHRFLALMRSLPAEAKLVEIAGYRSYEPKSEKTEDRLKRLRDEWALPIEEEKLLDWQRSVFGDIKPKEVKNGE